MTPRSSRGVSIATMPLVTHTAAFCGLRPVAKAFGCGVGLTYSRGIGWLADADSSRTIAYSWGASCSVTGRAPIERSAILSEKKYETAVHRQRDEQRDHQTAGPAERVPDQQDQRAEQAEQSSGLETVMRSVHLFSIPPERSGDAYEFLPRPTGSATDPYV